MVVLESMARNSTVASDIDSIREIVADGESGLLFPAGDSATLGKLSALLDDPVHARALAARGRERVESAFRSTTMAARYESLYRRLLDAARARTGVERRMSTAPDVSILLPTRNRAHLIERAIKSVLRRPSRTSS